jgi:tRNA dimethylallyltransferase
MNEKNGIDKKNNTLIVLLGPTAVGKTMFSLELAEYFDCEIVSADSMQIYKYMDIGSAKPSEEELSKVKHHLIGAVDPREKISAFDYKNMATEAISKIIADGKIPLLTGGTGLYVDAVLRDLDFAASPPKDPELRGNLYALAEEKGNFYLHDMLKKEDPDAAGRIHPNNVKRVVRAIEASIAGNPIQDFASTKDKRGPYRALIVRLERNRQELYDRINLRVDKLFSAGLIDEVIGLMDMGLTEDDISMKGLGYKEVISYLSGEIDLNDTIDLIKKSTRHYAKRQETWLKRYDDWEEVALFNISEYANEKDALEAITEWLTTKLGSTIRATSRTI